MPIRIPAIQHSIRRPMYPGPQINNTPNDIINIALESATDVRNIRSTLKCNCRLRLKKQLRHGNYSNKDTKQEINIQDISDETALISYQRDNAEEEPEIPENYSFVEMYDINFGNGIIAPEINSNYFEKDVISRENKSEIDEETEQELQGNDDSKVGYDDEQTIEHAQKLQVNDETAVFKPNDKKIKVLDDIIIKHASKTNEEILKTISDIIVLKKGNSSSEDDKQQNINAQKIKVVNNNNVNEQNIHGNENILEAYNEIVLKQTNSNVKVEEIHNIDLKNIDFTTKNTSTKIRENENTQKATQFNNFKVPKKITHSKKKIVKRQQPRFVLTHVVGGYIIQESNFAFPIREPQSQKNKTQTPKIEETAPTEVKEVKVVQEESGPKELVQTEGKEKESVVLKESGKEDPASPKVKEDTVVQEESGTEEPAPIEVKEYVKKYVANGEFNPFARLQQSTVKSWTVEDLSNHLLKCNWEKTASLLQDNEIDGASLFMVTKTQLMIIGVNEEQANVISEFVQSGPSK